MLLIKHKFEIISPVNLRKLTLLFSATLLLVAAASSPLAYANNYQLQPIANLAKHNTNLEQWLAPLPNPSNQEQLYLANRNGQISLLNDDTIENTPMLDLSQALSGAEHVMLTAFALHPDFSLRKRLGYNVFYTAHVEPFNEDIDTTRIEKTKHNALLSHDAVITQWRLNIGLNNKQADLSSKREVLRIAINKAPEHITQLGFDPNSKSWNADYGLLHIALSSSAELNQSPLYSGSILRLNPAEIGLKNYTIPPDNPFINNTQIQDEIIIFGAQHPAHFFWSKQSGGELLLSYQLNEQPMFAYALIGTDLQQEKSNTLVWQTKIETPVRSSLFYLGRELDSLWMKTLMLTKTAKQWQLSSLTLHDKTGMPSETLSVEWLINTDKIALENNASIHVTHNDELLLLDHTDNMLYQIVSNASAYTAEKSTSIFPWIIALVLLVITMFLVLKFRPHSRLMQSKVLLAYQFTRFELNSLEQSISLFRPHFTASPTTLQLVDIISSEIFLNDKSINLINTRAKNGFNEAKEKIIIECFEQEKRRGMLDEKTRKVNLLLRDSNQQKYVVCAYQREGNQRLTKKDFNHILGQLIDWSWHIAKVINPDATPEKIVKSPQVSVTAKKKMAQKQNKTMHNNVDVAVTKPSVPKTNSMLTPSTVNDSDDKLMTQSKGKQTVDSDFVDALEKLVKLKQQGYLTDDEFSLSKMNIFATLSNKRL